MILRKYTEATPELCPEGLSEGPELKPLRAEESPPMRWRLLTMTAVIVTIAVAMMSLLTYLAITSVLTRAFDEQLDDRANAIIETVHEADSRSEVIESIDLFQRLHPSIAISVEDTGTAAEGGGTITYNYGDTFAIDEYLVPMAQSVTTTVQNVGPARVLVKRNSTGETVVLAMEMHHVQDHIAALGSVLLVIAVGGILVSIAAGLYVSSAGLRPLARFQGAVDRITDTGELRPIEVVGNDELAQLTRSFNTMVHAIQEARDRQGRFVADAGHELKTPLTSIRTNIELLMMVSRSGSPIDDGMRSELEADVIAQLDEMSTLVGDLVGLARVESTATAREPVDLEVVLATCLERVRRRYPDVTFEVDSQPWILLGDVGALERAVLNLLGNAGKWSPPAGTVRVVLEEDEEGGARLVVADHGPGIAEEEWEKVFDRFYRAAESRSLPGSGLGLAIVRQAITSHSGTVHVEHTDGGGASLVVELPASLRLSPDATARRDSATSTAPTAARSSPGAPGRQNAAHRAPRRRG